MNYGDVEKNNLSLEERIGLVNLEKIFDRIDEKGYLEIYRQDIPLFTYDAWSEQSKRIKCHMTCDKKDFEKFKKEFCKLVLSIKKIADYKNDNNKQLPKELASIRDKYLKWYDTTGFDMQEIIASEVNDCNKDIAYADIKTVNASSSEPNRALLKYIDNIYFQAEKRFGKGECLEWIIPECRRLYSLFLSWNYKAGRFLSQHERNEQLKKLIIELAETLFIHKYADSKEEHDFRQKPDSPTRKDGLIYNGQLNTFVDEKVLNADSQKYHDYLWQYVAQQIDELFASIDNVGYLFVEENWAINFSEQCCINDFREYKCKMKCSQDDYKKFKDDFKLIMDELLLCGAICYKDVYKYSTNEIYTAENLKEFIDTYLTPFEIEGFNQDMIKENERKIYISKRMNRVIEKFVEPDKLTKKDIDFYLLYKDENVSITQNSIDYNKKYLEKIHKGVVERIGEGIDAEKVIYQTVSIFTLLGNKTLEIAFKRATIMYAFKLLAQLMIIHRFAVSKEEIDNC